MYMFWHLHVGFHVYLRAAVEFKDKCDKTEEYEVNGRILWETS